MAGTVEGGEQARDTIYDKYGNKFYQVIGARGGASSRTGGFGQGTIGKIRASIWGKVGGTISRKRGQHNTIPKMSEQRRLKLEAQARLRQLSDTQVSSLSAKYGKPRGW
jgi:DnaJ-class molecular chaperone